jgi:hypothetical protein
MSKCRPISLVAVAVVLTAGALRAQRTAPYAQTSTPESSNGQAGDGETTPQTTPVETEQPTPASSDIPQTVYVPALDGTGLIALDHSTHSRYLYGASYSGGFDSNPDDLQKGPRSGAFLFSPFIGIQGNTQNVQYVVQYQPTLRRYTEDQYQGGSLHTASVKVTGNVNERWNWNVNAVGSHGLDSVRLLGALQNVAVGDIPGTGPASASYRPDAGTITYIDGDAGLKFSATERDSIALNVANSFSSYSALQGDSNVATTTVAYTRSVTPKFQWINYAQGARYYGVIHCFTFGGGVGLEWKPQEHSYLHLSGGPQVDSSRCGKQQGFAYSAEFSTRITAKSQIYVTSARDAASSYLGPGLWQNTVSAGYQHDFDKDQSLGVDFGYVGTPSLEGVVGYSGTYADASYRRRFGHSFSAALSYRRYAGDWTKAAFTRNTALLSLSWTPSAGHVFQ